MQGLLKLRLEKLLFLRLNNEMQRYQAFSRKQADTRISKGSNVPIKDVFSFLLEAKDPETGKPYKSPLKCMILKAPKALASSFPSS